MMNSLMGSGLHGYNNGLDPETAVHIYQTYVLPTLVYGLEVTLPEKVSKVAKIRNRYNQVPHLTQDTNGKVTNSQKTPQTRAKRSALSQQVTTKHI